MITRLGTPVKVEAAGVDAAGAAAAARAAAAAAAAAAVAAAVTAVLVAAPVPVVLPVLVAGRKEGVLVAACTMCVATYSTPLSSLSAINATVPPVARGGLRRSFSHGSRMPMSTMLAHPEYQGPYECLEMGMIVVVGRVGRVGMVAGKVSKGSKGSKGMTDGHDEG
jgi:hypothetical protein